jgi:hypothetical protein
MELVSLTVQVPKGTRKVARAAALHAGQVAYQERRREAQVAKIQPELDADAVALAAANPEVDE